MFARLTCALTMAAAASIASADLVNPLVPSWAGDATASTYEWNSFTSAFQGPNFPDSPFSNAASLSNSAPGAIIAGSGNIYSPATGLDIKIEGTGSSSFELAVLNIATMGTELDYSNTFVSVTNGVLTEDIYAQAIERARIPMGEMGSAVTVAYEFDLSDVGFAFDEWSFRFSGSTANISLDAVRLDLNTIPAPGALLALGFAPMIRRRRR